MIVDSFLDGSQNWKIVNYYRTSNPCLNRWSHCKVRFLCSHSTLTMRVRILLNQQFFKWANPGCFLFILVLFSSQFKYNFKSNRYCAWGSHQGPQNDEHSKMPECRKSKWTRKMLMLKCQKLREQAALIQEVRNGLRVKFEIRQIWNCSNVISSNRQGFLHLPTIPITTHVKTISWRNFCVEFVLYSEIIPGDWTFKSCDNF